MKRIDILYFKGCPNHEPAFEMARDAVADLGIDVEINEIEVVGPEDAAEHRFLGSPSIHVDGLDVEPSARARTDFGFSCRTYSGKGLPDSELLISALNGSDCSAPGEGMDRASSCCDHDEPNVVDPTQESTSSVFWVSGGSVIAAIVASACCWLPLTLVAFGVSASGAGALFETTRPYFLAVAASLLLAGFYLSYRREKECAPGSACEAPNLRRTRFNRAMLWVAAVGVAGFASFPLYVDVFFPESTGPSTPISESAVGRLDIRVEGMSCEACAITLHNALMEVPSVLDANVSFEKEMAMVNTDITVPPSTELLIAAVKKAGYRGSLGSASE